MYSHVTVGTNDYARAKAFYDAVLAPLGLGCIHDGPEEGAAGWALSADRAPHFWLVRPFDRQAATVGNGVTVAFEAPDRATVDAVYAAARAAGAGDEGAPGLRPHYHPDYYGAYFRDLDGNKLCVVCHRPE
ncbi:VOC family protein [Stella sp.]|uniref:VOC family protein n=1 Tax=Stella sp. TaxID=2912054 RepID=UPI0035B27EDF